MTSTEQILNRKRAQLEEILYNFIPFIEDRVEEVYFEETGFLIRDRDSIINEYFFNYEDTIDRFLRE